MPRLVRRAPLSERIAAYLNPWDFLLWLSEELNSNEWEDSLREWSPWIGAGMNLVFMIARANSGGPTDRIREDDVFGDFEGRSSSGWFTWFCTFLVHFLSLISFGNAIYTFTRKRNYRLFEQSVDTAPSTPSAHRVRVDSSPLASSPLRLLSNVISSGSAESRAHPDAARDVWEISVWDPTPFCLGLFCLFSPGHVLLYWVFLPIAKLDPRPSITVVITILIAVVLSLQLSLLEKSFSQQSKDSTLIHRQVMSEYDTKFVHPALNKPYRDVGIQTPSKKRQSGASTVSEVDTYKPAVVINRGFRTNPNPTYASQYDPDQLQQPHQRSGFGATPSYKSSASGPTYSSSSTGMELLTSPAPSSRPTPAMRQPQFRPPTVGGGDGGSLGVYSHASSPLRKAASTNALRSSDETRRDRSPVKREGSPLKRMSTPSGFQSPLRDGPPIPSLSSRLAASYRQGDSRRESGRF